MGDLKIFLKMCFFKVIVKYTIKEIQAFASASAIAQEVLQNIRTVTAFHGQKKEEERLVEIIKRDVLIIPCEFYLDSLKI